MLVYEDFTADALLALSFIFRRPDQKLQPVEKFSQKTRDYPVFFYPLGKRKAVFDQSAAVLSKHQDFSPPACLGSAQSHFSTADTLPIFSQHLPFPPLPPSHYR